MRFHPLPPPSMFQLREYRRTYSRFRRGIQMQLPKLQLLQAEARQQLVSPPERVLPERPPLVRRAEQPSPRR